MVVRQGFCPVCLNIYSHHCDDLSQCLMDENSEESDGSLATGPFLPVVTAKDRTTKINGASHPGASASHLLHSEGVK
jgi:hypothetical protein